MSKKQHPKLKPASGGDQKRNTHNTNNGLEDALAVLWEIIDESTRVMLFIASKAKRIAVIMKILRSGPHSYRKNVRYDDADKAKDKDKYSNL